MKKTLLKKEFIVDFKNGDIVIKEDRLYRFKVPYFIGDAPTHIIEEYGCDILKQLYFEEYFYMDLNNHSFDCNTDSSFFKLMRNNEDINWDIWGRHKKLISTLN